MLRSLASRSTGFTLIEVLAALIIVSLGMLGVIQAVSQTASNSAYLRDKTLAHWIAMNRLTEIRLEEQPPDIETTSDEVEYAGRRWRWRTEVSETPIESMRRIDVRVALADSGDDRSSLAMVTGFYGMSLAPAGAVVISWEAIDSDGDPRTRGRGGRMNEGEGANDADEAASR